MITASVGSRGHALAWAANRLGITLTVVVPDVTPASRRDAVSRLGANVIVSGATVPEAKAEVTRLVAERGLTPVGSHDAPSVIAGAGTVAPLTTTFAPSRATASRRDDGVTVGTTTVRERPSRLAAHASACPREPTDDVITPASLWASGSPANSLTAHLT